METITREKPKFSRAEIVLAVKRLHKAGEPLNISAVREKHPDLLLAAYSQPRFLGWRRALELAGIDYSDIKVHLAKYVTCRECGATRRDLGPHLRELHGVSAEEYRRAYPSALIMANATAAKLRHAKVCALPHWEPDWTPEYVLDRVYQFYLTKIPLSSRELIKRDAMTICRARQYFGDWETVLTLVGLDPRRHMKHASPKKWSREDVVKTILQRHKSGHDVSRTGMTGHNLGVLWASKQIFGSYDGALRAAGLDPAKIRHQPVPARRYKTEDDVIREICRRRLMERPLHDSALRLGTNRDLSLWNKARRLFGRWSTAVEAAGFEYRKISPGSPRYLSKGEVTEAIMQRKKNGWALSAQGVRRGESKDPNLYARGCRFFGDWKKALRAAGIRHKDVARRASRYATKESVLAELQQREEKGLPLTIKGIRKSEFRDGLLHARALHFFGNWVAALSKAGVRNPGVWDMRAKYPTARSVISGIQKREQTGLPLHSTRVLNDDSGLYHAAYRFFGTWKKTMRKARVDYAAVCIREGTRRPRSYHARAGK